MRCPRCNQENPAEARFCLHCGAQLAISCPGCGAMVYVWPCIACKLATATRRVKGTIHWVSAAHALPAEVLNPASTLS